jgi:hypothetical protein
VRALATVAACVVLVPISACSDDDEPAIGGEDETAASDSGVEADTDDEEEADEEEADEHEGPIAGEDHWHAAYGIWTCDEFVPPLGDVGMDEFGIHTHTDGLIHIHPFFEDAAGENAVLGVFAHQIAVELDDGAFALPTGETFETGDECEGAPGDVVVIEWAAGAAPDDFTVHTDDVRDIRLRNGSAYTIAFASPTTDLAGLLPPSLPDIDDVTDLPPGELPSDDLPPITGLELPPAGGCPTEPAIDESDLDDVVRFQPVLSVTPSDCESPAGLPPDDGGARYELGDALPDGMIESAEAIVEPTNGRWVVLPLFNEGSPGIEDLNAVAARCFETDESCPTGQLAIVFRGRVLVAPVISQPSFDVDSIQIVGDFGPGEARTLARALAASEG